MKIFLLLLSTAYLAQASTHKGHQVVRLFPEKNHHVRFLHGLMTKETGMDLDFYTEPKEVGFPVDVQVPPLHTEALKAIFEEHDLNYEVLVEDLQDKIDDHMKQNREARLRRLGTPDMQYNFDDYMEYDDIMAWLDQRAADCGPRCEVISIGSTYEGRDLRVIKITDGSGIPNKPVAWIDGGIHAREWIAHAVVTYFIDRMVDEFAVDPQVQAMLDTYDWYFMPCLNADGYVYTHTTNRLWRKTRKPNVGSTCIGCDANRNFDHNFAGTGTSGEPCSNIYHGGSPFSQPCTQAVGDFLTLLNGEEGRIHIFLTLHCYSQLWMAPWGYSTQRPPNYNELMRVGEAAVSALYAVHGTYFRVGSASEILYASSGTSRDWAYGVPGIRWVYTLELRDTGSNGFILPPDQIRPSGEETWVALKAMYSAIQLEG